MTPEVERFLDLATRELEAQPELRDEARGELMSRVNHQGMPLEMLDLGEPIGRLESTKRQRSRVRRALYLAGFLVLLMGMGVGIGFMVRNAVFLIQVQMLEHRYGLFGGGDLSKELAVEKWVKGIAPDLLFHSSISEETSALLEEYPDDRMIFAQHLLRLRRESGSSWRMTEADLARAERLDPGNGLYSYIQIDSHIDRAFGVRASSRSSLSPSVVDEAEFEKALELFSQAAGAEFFSDYSGQLRRRQLETLPRADDLMKDELHIAFSEQVLCLFNHYSGYDSRVQRIIKTKVERLVKDGDAQGLLALRDDLLGFSELLVVELQKGGVSGSGIKDWIRWNAQEILNELDTLGQTNAHADLNKMVNQLDSIEFTYQARYPGGPPSPTARLGRWQDTPAGLTRDEVVPAGRTEWALAERVMVHSLSLVGLWLVLFTAFEAFRRKRLVKGLAKGLMPLFRWSDHLWIGGLGIVFPLVWYLGITRGTPLGMYDLSFEDLNEMALVVSAIQWAGAFVMGAIAMLWATYWRWEKRGGFLCLRGGGVFAGWILALLAAASVPLAGMARFITFKDEETMAMFLVGAGGLPAMGLLWLLWIGIFNLCTPQTNALRANLVSRTVLGWYLVAGFVLVAGAELLRQEERYWMSKDTLFPTWTSETHANALEERVALEYQHELGRILGIQ